MDVEITKEFIESVAKNANLILTEEEIKTFQDDFNSVLSNFEKISEVDLEGIEPSFHPVEVLDKVREDVPKESISNSEAFSNVQNKQDNYIRGPKIV
jgi:aspartyl-tRNA(Asn)/glutamyl-tRNA(Gln) amidotransferase subunit C